MDYFMDEEPEAEWSGPLARCQACEWPTPGWVQTHLLLRMVVLPWLSAVAKFGQDCWLMGAPFASGICLELLDNCTVRQSPWFFFVGNSQACNLSWQERSTKISQEHPSSQTTILWTDEIIFSKCVLRSSRYNQFIQRAFCESQFLS